MKTPRSTQELIAATRGAAAAFIEDMPHIRAVLNRPDPDRGEIRRLSNVLRRLLIDGGGDLRDIAAPRIGRFNLLSPDNSPVLKIARNIEIPFYQSAGASVYGVFIRATLVSAGATGPKLNGFDPDKTVLLPMDNFLSQHVICLKGQWASRRDVIKYIANVASGVHSGTAKQDSHHLLNRARRVARYSTFLVPEKMGAAPGTMGVSYNINVNAIGGGDLDLSYSATDIDPVLAELLAAARFLSESPDIARLEAVVTQELT